MMTADQVDDPNDAENSEDADHDEHWLTLDECRRLAAAPFDPNIDYLHVLQSMLRQRDVGRRRAQAESTTCD